MWRFHEDCMVMCCWAPSGPQPPRRKLEASEASLAVLGPLLAASEPFQADLGHSEKVQEIPEEASDH